MLKEHLSEYIRVENEDDAFTVPKAQYLASQKLHEADPEDEYEPDWADEVLGG